MREKVILVIDDDDMNLQIAKMILEKKLPCKVIGVDNGFEGLEILRKQRVNLVLLDILMPVYDGIEMLQDIRGNEQIKDIPVMMLTASGDIDDIQRAGKLGVKDYIKKPFMPADLIARVEKKLAEEPPGAEVLLVGDDENILQEMRQIIELNFNHEALIAKSAEEILSVGEVDLIIACADMKFVDGVKILSLIAGEEKFKAVPFALTTPEKLLELIEKLKPEPVEEPAEEKIAPPDENPPVEEKIWAKPSEPITEKEPPAVEEVADSTVIHKEKKKLANVVTTLIGYDLDIKI